MAIVRETERGLRIRSFGSVFQMMLVWCGGFALCTGLLASERDVPWYGYAVVGFLGLIALLHLAAWRSLPRVVIDRRLRLVDFGNERLGWDVFAGIYLTVDVRRGPKGSKFKDYTLWLLLRDGSGARKILVSASEDDARSVRGRVADLMQIERLPDRGRHEPPSQSGPSTAARPP